MKTAVFLSASWACLDKMDVCCEIGLEVAGLGEGAGSDAVAEPLLS